MIKLIHLTHIHRTKNWDLVTSRFSPQKVFAIPSIRLIREKFIQTSEFEFSSDLRMKEFLELEKRADLLIKILIILILELRQSC